MEKVKHQWVLFGNMKVLNKSAHNKYFNYYLHIKMRPRCVLITLQPD